MNLPMLFAAFSGGVFGAILGGTASFVFTGIIALMGTSVLLATGDSTLLDVVAFGPFFGPHIAFVGGVAASALAGVKRESLQAEGNELCNSYLEGANCAESNFQSRDISVILIAGVFGIIGYLINELIASTGIAIDTIALTVVLSNLLSRFVVARDGLVGSPEDHEITGQTTVFTFIWSLTAAFLTAFAVMAIKDSFGVEVANIGWAISAISLIFIYTNMPEFPASHHVTMNAGYFTVATGNIWVGAIAGAITGVLGEYVQKYTNTGVKSHLDMPAITIAIGSFIAMNLF